MLDLVKNAAVVYYDYCTRCTKAICKETNLFYGVV